MAAKVRPIDGSREDLEWNDGREKSLDSLKKEPSLGSSQTQTSLASTLDPELKGSLNLQLIVTILSCAFGSSFHFGFHFGNFNTPHKIIKEWQKDSFQRMHPGQAYPEEWIWSITVGILGFGALCSCFFVGILADWLGRKRTLIYNNAIVVLFCVIFSFAIAYNNYMLLIVARFVIGLNAGINTGLSAMYLNECAPINLRGAIGCVEQLFGLFGILFANLVGMPFALGTVERWPYIFYCSLIPLTVQLTVMLHFAPESPKYTYIIKGRVQQAEEDLQLLRNKKDVSAELFLLEHEALVAKLHPNFGLLRMLREAELRWLLLLALYLAFTIQFSGFGAIEVYSTEIFQMAHLSEAEAQWASCGLVGLIVFTVIVCICVVERPWIGRRPLFLFSTAGSCVSTAMAGLASIFAGGGTLSMVCVLLYILFYSIGMGSISAVYLNEFFPTQARATGCGIAMLAHQAFRTTIQVGFPPITKPLGHGSFFIFTACLFVSTLLGFLILPETKNRVPDHIERSIECGRRRLRRVCRWFFWPCQQQREEERKCKCSQSQQTSQPSK